MARDSSLKLAEQAVPAKQRERPREKERMKDINRKKIKIKEEKGRRKKKKKKVTTYIFHVRFFDHFIRKIVIL